jgi:hypothetical protein
LRLNLRLGCFFQSIDDFCDNLLKKVNQLVKAQQSGPLNGDASANWPIGLAPKLRALGKSLISRSTAVA